MKDEYFEVLKTKDESVSSTITGMWDNIVGMYTHASDSSLGQIRRDKEYLKSMFGILSEVTKGTPNSKIYKYIDVLKQRYSMGSIYEFNETIRCDALMSKIPTIVCKGSDGDCYTFELPDILFTSVMLVSFIHALSDPEFTISGHLSKASVMKKEMVAFREYAARYICVFSALFPDTWHKVYEYYDAHREELRDWFTHFSYVDTIEKFSIDTLDNNTINIYLPMNVQDNVICDGVNGLLTPEFVRKISGNMDWVIELSIMILGDLKQPVNEIFNQLTLGSEVTNLKSYIDILETLLVNSVVVTPEGEVLKVNKVGDGIAVLPYVPGDSLHGRPLITRLELASGRGHKVVVALDDETVTRLVNSGIQQQIINDAIRNSINENIRANTGASTTDEPQATIQEHTMTIRVNEGVTRIVRNGVTYELRIINGVPVQVPVQQPMPPVDEAEEENTDIEDDYDEEDTTYELDDEENMDGPEETRTIPNIIPGIRVTRAPDGTWQVVNTHNN